MTNQARVVVRYTLDEYYGDPPVKGGGVMIGDTLEEIIDGLVMMYGDRLDEVIEESVH